MNTQRCLLGIDLGTSSVKTALVTQEGQVLASGNAEYPILRPAPGHAEQDPRAWRSAIHDAVRMTVQQAPAPNVVAAIGLSGQMHGTVVVDSDGKPLAPAIIWPDQRSVEEVVEITERLGLERLTAIAGSPVATGFQAATLLWLRKHLPELWAQLDQALLPKDYIRAYLTGQYAAEPSDGSGSLLLDVRQRDWSPELLNVVGLRGDQLPPVQPSNSVAGNLREPAANAFGLPAGIPVITGAADTACSALGAGAASTGRLLLTLSSGGQLVAPVDSVQTDEQGRIHTFCSAMEPNNGPGWYQMGAILSAGLALRWLRDEVFALKSSEAYDKMASWAAESTLGAGGLLFLPYLTGERTPHMDPRARGCFLGLTAHHRRGDLVLSVMEGVAMACYDGYQVLTEMGAAPESIILAGGGANSIAWRQVVADLFGLPVEPLQAAEQSAVGAAILAGSGIGLFDVAETARLWARYGTGVEPDPDRHQRYGELFELFRKAYHRNNELFHSLHAWHYP